jgi:hypothetical protein
MQPCSSPRVRYARYLLLGALATLLGGFSAKSAVAQGNRNARPGPAPAAPALAFPIAQTCAPIQPPARQPGQPAGGRGGDSAAARRPGGTGNLAGVPEMGNQSVRAIAQAGVPGNGVLGGVCMTAQDSMIQQVVARLDFDSFKTLLKELSQFGDRWAGTPIGQGNLPAVNWIDEKLKSWGYVTERIKYTFEGEPREEVFATKVGSKIPGEMYIIGGHMDGRGGGQATNDDGSGTVLVMEIARVLASPDIKTDRTIRFALWNNEETGLNGARAYVEQRQLLQGIETPAGSGKFNEPRWLAMINHDMLLWDHGNPPMAAQSIIADVNVEFQLNSAKAAESAQLGLVFINANRMFASGYPAQLSNAMSNTDTGAFQDLVASISLRDGRRLYEMGRGSSPTYHQPTDAFSTFTDQDYRLGFAAVQTTLGAIGKLTEVKIVPAPPKTD